MFDLQSATKHLAAGIPACPETAVAYWYLHGLVAAREAYRFGGSPESLQLVALAMAELATRAGEVPAAEIARVVLQAASSAAQSEREEMGLFLTQALDLERKQFAAGLPGAPIVSAHEVAGDLWLQVHRYDDANSAYRTALALVGPTPRVELGLARTNFRLGELRAACSRYGVVVASWPDAGADRPELREARAFLRRGECRSEPEPRR